MTTREQFDAFIEASKIKDASIPYMLTTKAMTALSTMPLLEQIGNEMKIDRSYDRVMSACDARYYADQINKAKEQKCTIARDWKCPTCHALPSSDCAVTDHPMLSGQHATRQIVSLEFNTGMGHNNKRINGKDWIVGKVVKTIRHGCTYYGNPTMSITLMHPNGSETTYRISDNAGMVYGITNGIYAEAFHDYRLTRAGRVDMVKELADREFDVVKRHRENQMAN